MGLVGVIPPHLGNLSFLVELGLKNNSFHCPLPQELSRLRRLKTIDFGNNFMGTIPSWFGSFPKLQTFTLAGNGFSGFIPAAIFNLSTLEIINLSRNQPSELPYEIGSLGQLEVLFVQRNALKGCAFLPALNISSLTTLTLYWNNMSGNLPNNICTIPDEIGDLQQLEILALHANNLSGVIPSKLFNNFMIREIELSINQLSSGLRANIGLNVPNLEFLGVARNNLVAGLLPNLSNASKLRELEMIENSFILYLNNLTIDASTPQAASTLSCLFNLRNLTTLYLGDNPLNTTILAPHGNLSTSLLYVDLRMSNIKGNIPVDICNLSSMIKLNLGDDQLSGAIPSSIQRLKYLQEGPTSLSLELLDLSKNNLSGVIPKSMEALLYLKHLNLSFNKLQGEIPTGGPFGNFSADSFVSNGALCGAS
ncbi:probable LRR receptor-like serine/threonine-protein kinase At3g47570 [Malus domestica]|uniref:probable LRR receptor-like serine/threonine-protein kinase At3g47570 n=1 Tax=Malus domestica TaxID=3750 RepID=UPI0004991DE6